MRYLEGPMMRKKSSKNLPAKKRLKTIVPKKPKEFGGPKGPEPTRFGDWEQKGRCSDF